MVIAHHEEECGAVRVRRRDVEQAAEATADPRAKLLRRLGEIADKRKPARVVIDEVCRQDAVTRGRLPAELRTDALTLVTNSAREDVGAVAEATQQLGRLRRMAERIRDVSDAHRTAERGSDA